MRCVRCGQDVPDFVWSKIGDVLDHPVLLDHPITISHTDLTGSNNEVKITAHAYAERRMCSDVNPEPQSKPITAFQDEVLSMVKSLESLIWDLENLPGDARQDHTIQLVIVRDSVRTLATIQRDLLKEVIKP